MQPADSQTKYAEVAVLGGSRTDQSIALATGVRAQRRPKLTQQPKRGLPQYTTCERNDRKQKASIWTQELLLQQRQLRPLSEPHRKLGYQQVGYANEHCCGNQTPLATDLYLGGIKCRVNCSCCSRPLSCVIGNLSRYSVRRSLVGSPWHVIPTTLCSTLGLSYFLTSAASLDCYTAPLAEPQGRYCQ